MQKISLIFVILLFAICLSTLMFQDRSVLVSLWKQSPVSYSFAH
jgi:hypothetical protein